jgi:hypothetical protein
MDALTNEQKARLRELVEALRSPAYWFTAGFDERTGHWFSGSSAGHEGQNDLPIEAATVIDALLDEIEALRSASQKVVDAWAHYERYGAECTFESSPMIYAETLNELAAAACEALKETT